MGLQIINLTLKEISEEMDLEDKWIVLTTRKMEETQDLSTTMVMVERTSTTMEDHLLDRKVVIQAQDPNLLETEVDSDKVAIQIKEVLFLLNLNTRVITNIPARISVTKRTE